MYIYIIYYIYCIYINIYIYLLRSRCNNNVRYFSKLLKTHFLLCKYFAAISVASSIDRHR